ncbi:MAG: hypothetical protein KGL39_50180 [Patescibacteria group bacterium]|nr:hypothetical protein [Patescibacteria group bacterium]
MAASKSFSPSDDPTEQPYPGYAREKAALDAKAAEARRAASAPLPGALREAFAGDPRRLHGFTFQPVCAWLDAILTRIESPVLSIIAIYRDHAEEIQAALEIADDKRRAAELKALEKKLRSCVAKQVKSTPDQEMEMCFAFVTPVEESQQLLDQDRKSFTSAARAVIGKLTRQEFNQLARACGEHYFASFSTALHVVARQPATPGGAGEVFCQPPPAPKTASAGGSPSSAH